MGVIHAADGCTYTESATATTPPPLTTMTGICAREYQGNVYIYSWLAPVGRGVRYGPHRPPFNRTSERCSRGTTSSHSQTTPCPHPRPRNGRGARRALVGARRSRILCAGSTLVDLRWAGQNPVAAATCVCHRLRVSIARAGLSRLCRLPPVGGQAFRDGNVSLR
ncbi:hypothetical protein PYCCODRAFT_187309 [Trametes coccinea BRFM310]|uniref:Uncharacterized protein n=1 Tax=Trametes coccinea (strain BRFM310) TaxID=1353009 RepID=A0A1Y2IRD4_TRAC3|nr:hypothetical protein PYCCODRAFT_187309 [Trametes coccinea BRFM310]